MTIRLLLSILLIQLGTTFGLPRTVKVEQHIIRDVTLDNSTHLEISSTDASIDYLQLSNVTILDSSAFTNELLKRGIKSVDMFNGTISQIYLKPSFKNIRMVNCTGSEIVIDENDQNGSFNMYTLIIENSSITSLPNDISRLNKLYTLILIEGNLQTVNMSVLNGLSRLNILCFGVCNISEVLTSEPVELPMLILLELHYNQIKRLDTHRWSMPSMTDLNLAHNHLDEFPQLNRFPALIMIDISSNFLSSVNMHDVSGLKHLWSLNLSDNRILRLYASGSIHLPALRTIHLDRNFLQGLNLSAGNIPNLEVLHIRGPTHAPTCCTTLTPPHENRFGRSKVGASVGKLYDSWTDGLIVEKLVG